MKNLLQHDLVRRLFGLALICIAVSVFVLVALQQSASAVSRPNHQSGITIKNVSGIDIHVLEVRPTSGTSSGSLAQLDAGSDGVLSHGETVTVELEEYDTLYSMYAKNIYSYSSIDSTRIIVVFRTNIQLNNGDHFKIDMHDFSLVESSHSHHWNRWWLR